MKHSLSDTFIENNRTFGKWLKLARGSHAASSSTLPKQLNVFDTEAKNLMLRVSAGGTRTWMLIHYYVHADGKSKPQWLKLASFASSKNGGADRWPETGKPRYLSTDGARHARAVYTTDPEAFADRIKQAKVSGGLEGVADSNDATSPADGQGAAANVNNLIARLIKPKADFKVIEPDLDSLRESDFGKLLKTIGQRARYELVVYAYLRRYAANLRSLKEIKRTLDLYCLPKWHGRAFVDIAPNDVTNLYHEIRNDLKFASQAQNVFATIRGVGRWFEVEHIAKGYSCQFKLKRPKNERPRARDRILDDAEIKDMWRVAGQRGTFGALLKILLLTGQRKDKVVNMRWDDLSGATWTISTVPGEKGNAGVLELPPYTLSIINNLPRLLDCEFVFPNSYSGDPLKSERSGRFNSFANETAQFRKLLPPLPSLKEPWRLHDLRRTFRSRLSDLGISDRVGEVLLGHTIEGVEAVYNHSTYAKQKRQALQMRCSAPPRSDANKAMRSRSRRAYCERPSTSFFKNNAEPLLTRLRAFFFCNCIARLPAFMASPMVSVSYSCIRALAMV